MKIIISKRMNVLSFCLIAVLSVTFSSCFMKDKSEEPKALTNNNTSLPGDTTVTKVELDKMVATKDSLNYLYNTISTSPNEKLMQDYPLGYAVFITDYNTLQRGATILDENIIKLQWENARISEITKNGLSLVIPKLQMETMTLVETSIHLDFSYEQRNAGITSQHIRMFTQLIAKSKWGLIGVIGFKSTSIR